MNNSEFKTRLEDRTLAFAIEVVDFCSLLKKLGNPEVLITQLLKAGTSIGSNYREANRAESKKDFIHKIGIVEKESSETNYWLTLFKECDLVLNHEAIPLLNKLHSESCELLALFNSISRNSKKDNSQQ